MQTGASVQIAELQEHVSQSASLELATSATSYDLHGERKQQAYHPQRWDP